MGNAKSRWVFWLITLVLAGIGLFLSLNFGFHNGVGICSGILLVILCLLGWREYKQLQAEEGLRQLNQSLERTVEARTSQLQASNQTLTAQNEELTAMNEEIESLNMSLAGLNDRLETLVAERTTELTAANQELLAQYEEMEGSQKLMRRSADIQSILRSIAEAAVLEPSLDELYRQVHQAVKKVLPAENFYISILDEHRNDLVFPYCVDETGAIPRQRPAGNGLSDYVMRQRRTVLINPVELSRLRDSGEVRINNLNYEQWAGAPLIDSGGRAFGCLAFFLVVAPNGPLTNNELEVLTIIAAQVSQAIERKRTEHSLRESEERFRHALEFSDIGYFDGNLVQQTLLLSEHWRERLGLPTGNAVIGWGDYIDLVHPADLAHRQESMDIYLQQNLPVHEVEYRLRLPDGRWIWTQVRARALRDATGQPVRLLGTLSDITSAKKLEARKKFKAEHDEMTGLLNQQGFVVGVSGQLALGRLGGLMLIDIDDFELFNAVHGRAAGDEYLAAFARFLQDCFAETATVARFGGDGFAVFFPEVDGGQAVLDAYKKIETVCIETPAGTFFVQLSAGVSLAENPGDKLDMLIRQADMALNHAKKQGKWCCRIYEPFLQDLLTRRQVIREELNRAMLNQELHLVYQPIFDIRHERETVAGFEALLRWTSPSLGSVSPTEFIPMAESTSLILPIGKWVLEEACRFSLKYQEIFGKFTKIAVNISTQQLALSSFVEQVMTVLEQSGVPSETLNLEVTESILMSDVEKCVTCLTELRNQGIGISLDDFGTGYSSFTYLAKLPISTLKVDKSLVDGLVGGDANNSVLLMESLLHMSDKLNYKVVAEGVEQPEQLNLLRKMDCHYCQGYLLGRPKLAEDILQVPVLP